MMIIILLIIIISIILTLALAIIILLVTMINQLSLHVRRYRNHDDKTLTSPK